jgi:putative membrane protein
MLTVKWSALFLGVMMLAACKPENRSGLPETETTGTVQAAQETTTAMATTTGQTGGTSSALSPDDKEFLSKAGMGGLFEVEAGRLALQKAENPDVKAYAQRIVTDHSKANAELAQLATAKGTALPTELDGELEERIQHLSSLSGEEFDKAYMQHMTPDHQKDIAEFERAASGAADSDVKAWAAKVLPALREHLKLAVEVSSVL